MANDGLTKGSQFYDSVVDFTDSKTELNPTKEGAADTNVLKVPGQTMNTRERSYSLRTKLLNQRMHNQAEKYLDPIKSADTDNIFSDGNDIELKSVDLTYSSDKFVKKNEDENSIKDLTNESVFDLTEETPQNRTLRFNLDRPSQSADFYGDNTTDASAPDIFKKMVLLLKHIFLLLGGGRSDLPSVGGRAIPVTLNLSHTNFPKVLTKQKELLLLDERKDSPYVDNVITSSRYTLISFLPRQLLAQFSKIANCYFLLVSILQLIPSWSTTGTSTTIIPLSIFISISMLREGWEDIKRHKLDKEENNRITHILKEIDPDDVDSITRNKISKSMSSFSRLRSSSAQSFDYHLFEEEQEEDENKLEERDSFDDEALLQKVGIQTLKTRWKNLRVGDIIKLKSDEWVPADVVLLTSDNQLGETFVETMALDGETNLKSKIPNIELHKNSNNIKNLFNLSNSNEVKVLCEDPNLDLYNFEGSIDLPTYTNQIKTYPLGPDNVIYRGSIIRNTNSCLGLVIFSGEESKIRMNAIKNPRIKAPKLQNKINMIVAFMVVVVLCLSCFSLMAERIFFKKYGSKLWYTDGTDVGVAATIMGFIVMFNTMIPLSLYVTMEIIKAVQLTLLQWDIDMYHLKSDTPCEARTATILEELGQVSYVFSDKTGTLTDNVMLFRKFSVCGIPFIHPTGSGQTEADDEHPDASNDYSDIFSPNEINKPGKIITSGRPSLATLEFKKDHTPPKDEIKSSLDLIKYIQSNPNTLFSEKARLFLLSVALCHTCLPKHIEEKTADQDSIHSLDAADGTTDPFRASNDSTTSKVNENHENIEYQAASPDELALVQAACDMGFILYDKKLKIVTLKTFPNGFENEPEFLRYEILDVIEFTSSRKRMSVIVKFPNDRLVLLCKGADNVILERLDAADIVQQEREDLKNIVLKRKKAEAEFILNKRSMDINSSKSPRTSLSSIMSKNNKRDEFTNIENLLDSETEINDMVLESRKSIELEDNLKWKLTGNSFIPNEKLLTNEKFLIERTLKHIEEFSSEGLRTLLYSYRKLREEDYFSWSKRYSEAKTSLVNRALKIAEVGKELENNLILLGCTAIEDKLQDGVPDTIERLSRAGMKVWMLTGDKRETAINIGYSCKLIKDYSNVIILSNENKDYDLQNIITATDIEISAKKIIHSVIVIDGSTLTEVENDVILYSSFIQLCVKSDAVIVCRASPSQKSSIVLKVRSINKSKVTLAIGDGANDISMIQSADIGIGITGKEGLQASRSSDYSIAQFKYLNKLLLVHGRFNYIRTSKFVLCTFYKELLFYLSQLLYQRYTLFTGSSLYEPWSLSMFNTLFTSLPVLVVGMFDKDLNESTLISIPELYSKGINNESFNLILFIKWILLATVQSVSLSFALYYVYGFPALVDNTTYALGFIMFTVLIILINLKCNIIEMHTINKLSLISITISVLGWFVWSFLLVGLYKNKTDISIFYVYDELFQTFGRDFTSWLSILILIIFGLFIDLIFEFVNMLFFKSDSQVFQKYENDVQLREKMEFLSYDLLKQGWLWLHESQINDEKPTTLNKFRSFMKKGSTKPSAATRKRKATMVNPNELPPNFPSIVKIRSNNDEYIEEILPSGKIIKIKDGNRSYNRKGAKTGTEDVDFIEEDINIDKILQERKSGLNNEY